MKTSFLQLEIDVESFQKEYKAGFGDEKRILILLRKVTSIHMKAWAEMQMAII